ncbi:hypothetical protein CDIK_2497, partial [Cucumispora dikerogammari]
IDNKKPIFAQYIKVPKTLKTISEQPIISKPHFSLKFHLFLTKKEGEYLTIKFSIEKVPVFLIPQFVFTSNFEVYDSIYAKLKKHLFVDWNITLWVKGVNDICLSYILPKFAFYFEQDFFRAEIYSKKISGILIKNHECQNDDLYKKNFFVIKQPYLFKTDYDKKHSIAYFLKNLNDYEKKLKTEMLDDVLISKTIEKLRLLDVHLKEMTSEKLISEHEFKEKIKHIIVFQQNFKIDGFDKEAWQRGSPWSLNLKSAYIKASDWFCELVEYINTHNIVNYLS